MEPPPRVGSLETLVIYIYAIYALREYTITLNPTTACPTGKEVLYGQIPILEYPLDSEYRTLSICTMGRGLLGSEFILSKRTGYGVPKRVNLG